ncbi:MAG: hypothetical protein KUG81_04965 [Gammaproteobacteria bacterium]|nr:hypothetical protein [Gammaproteobacteria bacterium]
MSIVKIKNTRLQLVGTCDEGKQLELVAVDGNGTDIDDVSYPLARIFAEDQDETLIFEMYTDNGIAHIPVTDLKNMLKLAEEDVHSEAWYERNVY